MFHGRLLVLQLIDIFLYHSYSGVAHTPERVEGPFLGEPVSKVGNASIKNL